MDYKLILPNEQTDYARFIAHSAIYPQGDIEIAARYAKARLQAELPFIANLKAVVYLEILQSTDFVAYIVMDSAHNDVSLRIVNNKHDGFVASLLVGSDYKSHISVDNVNQNQFVNIVEKPAELLFVFVLEDVLAFLNEQKKKWLAVPETIATIKNQIAEQMKGAQQDGDTDNEGANQERIPENAGTDS